MKGNSFINLTDTDDKAGAFLLATAITTGVSDAVGFREYMMDPSRGIDILSAISPSLGAKVSAGKLGKTYLMLLQARIMVPLLVHWLLLME